MCESNIQTYDKSIKKKRLFNVFAGRSMIKSLVIEKISNGFMDGS